MEEVKIDYVGTYKRGIQTWGEAEIQGRFPDKIYPSWNLKELAKHYGTENPGGEGLAPLQRLIKAFTIVS